MEQAEALSQYRDYVKKNPSDKENARRSFYDAFGTDPEAVAFSKPKKAADVAAAAQKGAVSKTARTRLANIQAESAGVEYKQEMSNIKGRAVGEAAAMLPFAAAAPFTAGTSVGVGLGLMGAAGLAGGVLNEEAKALYGSTEMPKSGKALALTLGLDATMGVAGEGTGRVIGAVGKTLIPKLIERSAAKSDAGAKLLEDAFFDTRQTLYKEIQSKGSPVVDVEKPLTEAYELLGKLPKAKGELGKRFGGMTPKASEAIKAIEADLSLEGGGIAARQPLDGLIRAKGSLQRMAWEEGSLNKEERVIFKRLAEKLDERIKIALKEVGPEAQALYKKTNDLLITQKERHMAVSLAETTMKSIAGRVTLGTVGGGSYGYYQGRGARGTLEGAAAGAAIGALTALPPKLSTLLLEKTMSHPEAGALYRKAINRFIEGNEGAAEELAKRAMLMAGARDIIKDSVGQEGEFSMRKTAAVAPPVQPPQQQ